MVSKDFIIKNKMGLHMRPSQVFVREMSKYDSDVTVIFAHKRINAKSIMGLMAACIGCGAKITVICDGCDEQAMLDKAAKIIENSFWEV